jgi:hypothetical protein
MKLVTSSLGKDSITIEGENLDYELIFTKHALEDRTLMYQTNDKKKKERINEDLTLLKINHIIRPFIHKMVKNPGKYAIHVPINSKTNEFKMLIIACEEAVIGFKFVLVTAMTANFEKYIVFMKISPYNRFTARDTLEDLIKMPELNETEECYEKSISIKSEKKEKSILVNPKLI